MVDYTKVLITGVNIERLYSLDCLDFESQISKTTGEVNESIFIAEYRFCKVKILKANSQNPIVLFAGSIHKLWNDLNGIMAPNYNANKPYFGFNGNQFTLNDIIEVRVHLEKLFDCKASQMIIQNIEIGLNIEVDHKPIMFIKGLLYHRNMLFDFSHFGNNSIAIHSYYSLKIYSKSNQYGMIQNTLRVELKIVKMEELKRNKIDIITLEDINEHTLSKALKLLSTRFIEVAHYDYTIDKKQLTGRELKAIQNYSNPRYWMHDLKPNNRHRHLVRLEVITDKYSKRILQKIKNEIDSKCSTVNRQFTKKTKSKIDPKCSTVNQQFENPFCSTVNPLDKQLTVLQTTVQKEIKNEPKKEVKNKPKKDEFDGSICRVTGLSLKGQKLGSHFLSHTGLRLLFEKDRLKFDFVLQKHLPKQYKNSDLETKILQIAKSIRTKDCVSHIKATRIYPPHQPQLFG
jgi:hypothetical protein